MFQSAFCAIGIIGIVAGFGFFDLVWRWDFCIQFTNISNYMCVGIMIAELISDSINTLLFKKATGSTEPVAFVYAQKLLLVPVWVLPEELV